MATEDGNFKILNRASLGRSAAASDGENSEFLHYAQGSYHDDAIDYKVM